MSGGTRGQRGETTGYETPRQPEVAASSLAPSTAVRTASGSQLADWLEWAGGRLAGVPSPALVVQIEEEAIALAGQTPEVQVTEPHVHIPEKMWYGSTTDNKPVWSCTECNARVNPDGSEWRP